MPRYLEMFHKVLIVILIRN